MIPDNGLPVQTLLELFKSALHGLSLSASWARAKSREYDILRTAARAYADALEERHGFVKILGMVEPVPLRNLLVRVNILDKIRSRSRVSPESLHRTFDFDRLGFGEPYDTWNGDDLVVNETYRITDKTLAVLDELYPSASDLSRKHRRDYLVGNSYHGRESLFQALINVCPEFDRRRHSAAIVKEADAPPTSYIVLGKPGAGKTTFLKYLLFMMLDGKTQVARMPVFVGLRDFADSDMDLISFVVRDLESLGLPDAGALLKRLCKDGRCVFLCDGLDEIGANAQDRVIRHLQHSVLQYGQCQFIVSCRIAAYNYCFGSFTDVELADFDSRQVTAFVQNWFRGDARTAKDCLSRLRATRQMRELARTPLLLALLCLTYDRTLGFPSNRAELYGEGVDALLKRWDASRRIQRDEVYKQLSTKRKETLLSDIAASTFREGRYFIPQRHLEGLISDFVSHIENGPEIEPEAVLKAIEAQHGFFVERARGIYSFSHLTFHEFFTAKRMAETPAESSELMSLFAADRRWREVVLLTVGLLPHADPFFEGSQAWLDNYTRRFRIDGILRALQFGASRSVSHPPEIARCLLFLFWLREAKTLCGNERFRPGVGSLRHDDQTFDACIDDVQTVVRRLSGRGKRLALKYITELSLECADEARFSDLLASDADAWLAPAIRASFTESTRVARETINMRALVTYTKSVALLFECAWSDCYLSRVGREALRENAFRSLGASSVTES